MALLKTSTAIARGLLAAAIALPCAASAQTPTSATTTSCTYQACALSIAPRWNGLAVVRGTRGSEIANLNFFWPRDVSTSLAGSSRAAVDADSTAAEARRALRLRRIGAALTDGGAILVAASLARAASAGRIRRSDGVMVAAGAGALGMSIPLQFAADGALSRAVWWHNARYASP